MVEAIVKHLLLTAGIRFYQWTNPLTGEKETVNGRLRVFTRKQDCPYTSDAVSLPQLVEFYGKHGATESDVKRAVGSLWPTAGTGRKLFVWFYTEDRAAELKAVRDLLATTLRDSQRANRMMYLAEMGVSDATILPDFTQFTATIQ